MNQQNLARLSQLNLLICLAAMTFSCGKKSSNSQDTQNIPPAAVGKLQLGIVATNYQNKTTALNLDETNTEAGPPFRATSIFSGAPEYFAIYIKEISLNGTTASGAPLRISPFKDNQGKPIEISGAKVDLSQLFSNYTCYTSQGNPVELKTGETCECGLDDKGKLLKKVNMKDEKTGKTELKCDTSKTKTPPVGVIDIASGSYTSISVTYSSKASIKGCLTGFFRTNSTGVGDTSKAHTYCTQQSGSLFTGDEKVTLQTFEDKNPEVMDTALSGVGGPNTFTADKSDTSVEYQIDGGLKIEEGKATRLTLLIDTNRMLRFEAANREDAVVLKPGWPKSRPYFFSTVFADSSFVFTGEPGEIRGHDFSAYSCRDNTLPCKGTNNAFYLEGWITSIFDKKGKPIIVSYMPNDDSTLTVIKGNNQLVVKDPTKGIVRKPDDTAYSINAQGALTLKYYLGESTGSMTLEKEPKAIDDKVSGTFKGFQNSSGEVSVTRRL